MNTSAISGYNQPSIIAEMHYQNGMNSFKEDLQRKIHNYQSILKKTYAVKEQKSTQNTAIKVTNQHMQQPKSPFEYNKFKTIEHVHPATHTKVNNYIDEDEE